MSIKKLLVFIALCFGAYQFLYVDKVALLPASNLAPESVNTRGTFVTPKVERAFGARAEHLPSGSQNFRCDGRQYCSQMKSLAEAQFFLRNCPDVKMDGDHDGKPCERQFDY